jgi:hypothetical protein
MYGIASPAPVCADDSVTIDAGGQVACQVVQAPESPHARLVVDTFAGHPHVTGAEQIRLTYAELSALIEDAIRNLR